MTPQEQAEYDVWHPSLEELEKEFIEYANTDVTSDVILNYWYSYKKYEGDID